MRYPRATIRVSGQPMVTVKVEHHLTLDDVAGILVSNCDSTDEIPVTKQESWEKIKRHLKDRGLNAALWDHVTDEMEIVAFRRARQLFPELLGKINS